MLAGSLAKKVMARPAPRAGDPAQRGRRFCPVAGAVRGYPRSPRGGSSRLADHRTLRRFRRRARLFRRGADRPSAEASRSEGMVGVAPAIAPGPVRSRLRSADLAALVGLSAAIPPPRPAGMVGYRPGMLTPAC